MSVKYDLSPLDAVFAKHEGEYGALISILQQAQEIYGYLPDDVLAQIVKRTGNSIAQVRGVATFYTQFRFSPAGKYVIQLCTGTACHVNGSDLLVSTLRDVLGITDGQTTDDGLFSLDLVACLGCCSLSPVVMINGEAYGSMTPQKLTALINDIKAKEACAK